MVVGGVARPLLPAARGGDGVGECAGITGDALAAGRGRHQRLMSDGLLMLRSHYEGGNFETDEKHWKILALRQQ